MFRLLIASRDEPDIRAALSHLNVDVCDVPIGDDSTSHDIKLLFERRLASNAPAFVDRRLPSDWPGEPVIRQLVALSGGLFIWASTTIRFIESGFPGERLKKVLSASAHGPSHARLDDLYRVALTHPFDSYNESELKVVHSILGAIVVAREQLTDGHLVRLLGLEISDVREVLSLLQPLLRGGHGQPFKSCIHRSPIFCVTSNGVKIRDCTSTHRPITLTLHLAVSESCNEISSSTSVGSRRPITRTRKSRGFRSVSIER